MTIISKNLLFKNLHHQLDYYSYENYLGSEPDEFFIDDIGSGDNKISFKLIYKETDIRAYVYIYAEDNKIITRIDLINTFSDISLIDKFKMVNFFNYVNNSYLRIDSSGDFEILIINDENTDLYSKLLDDLSKYHEIVIAITKLLEYKTFENTLYQLIEKDNKHFEKYNDAFHEFLMGGCYGGIDTIEW